MSDRVDPTGYHAHVYDPTGESGLQELHTRAEQELDSIRVGRLRAQPVGPHAEPMFQLPFETHQLSTVLAWLLRHRDGRSVLVHPLHGNVRREHDEDALWLGAKLPLDLDKLGPA
ncbi:MAG: DOPA 4,5-dioxygenase family protein [Myxococcota bacterium]